MWKAPVTIPTASCVIQRSADTLVRVAGSSGENFFVLRTHADRSARAPQETHGFSAFWADFIAVNSGREGSFQHLAPKARVVIGGPLRQFQDLGRYQRFCVDDLDNVSNLRFVDYDIRGQIGVQTNRVACQIASSERQHHSCAELYRSTHFGRDSVSKNAPQRHRQRGFDKDGKRRIFGFRSGHFRGFRQNDNLSRNLLPKFVV